MSTPTETEVPINVAEAIERLRKIAISVTTIDSVKEEDVEKMRATLQQVRVLSEDANAANNASNLNSYIAKLMEMYDHLNEVMSELETSIFSPAAIEKLNAEMKTKQEVLDNHMKDIETMIVHYTKNRTCFDVDDAMKDEVQEAISLGDESKKKIENLLASVTDLREEFIEALQKALEDMLRATFGQL